MADNLVQQHQKIYGDLKSKIKSYNRDRDLEKLISLRRLQLRECESIVKHCNRQGTKSGDDKFFRTAQTWQNTQKQVKRILEELQAEDTNDEYDGYNDNEDDEDEDDEDEDDEDEDDEDEDDEDEDDEDEDDDDEDDEDEDDDDEDDEDEDDEDEDDDHEDDDHEDAGHDRAHNSETPGITEYLHIAVDTEGRDRRESSDGSGYDHESKTGSEGYDDADDNEEDEDGEANSQDYCLRWLESGGQSLPPAYQTRQDKDLKAGHEDEESVKDNRKSSPGADREDRSTDDGSQKDTSDRRIRSERASASSSSSVRTNYGAEWDIDSAYNSQADLRRRSASTTDYAISYVASSQQSAKRRPSSSGSNYFSIDSDDETNAREYLTSHGIDLLSDELDTDSAMKWAVRDNEETVLALLIPLGVNPTTAFHYALSRRRYWLARFLLERCGAVNGQDGDELGWALADAAAAGSRKMVQELLKRGARVNWRDGKAMTPLMYAAGGMADPFEVVEILLEHGAEVDAVDTAGETALMKSCRNNNQCTARVLIRAGADPERVNQQGTPPVAIAVLEESYCVVKMLIRAGVDLSYRDPDGNSLLTLALVKPITVKTINELVEAGLDVNAANHMGVTPLWFAAEQGDLDSVRELLRAGAAHAIADQAGNTPLARAAERGNWRVVHMMLSEVHHLNVDPHNRDNETPMLLAAKNGHPRTTRLLLDAGADLHVRDRDGYTALTAAAEKGFVHTVRVILGAGADCGVETQGRTALALAAMNGHAGVIEHLLEAGARVDARDTDGRTPMALAAMNGHVEIIELLLSAGANLHARDNDGRTAHDLADQQHHDSIAGLLGNRMNHLFDPGVPSSPVYKPLTGLGDTRVIVIQPGVRGDPVRCSLRVIPFRSRHATYRALSYVWGIDEPRHKIWINGMPFLVRDNLYSALRCIRVGKEAQTIWVDALCIDQGNVTEKGFQIQAMTGIYRHATEVIIWLGTDPYLGLVFQNIAKEVQDMVRNKTTGDMETYARSGVSAVLDNPYFQRAWIYQEIVCSGRAKLWSAKERNDGSFITDTLQWRGFAEFYKRVGERVMLQQSTTEQFSTAIGSLVKGQEWFRSKGWESTDLLSLLEVRRNSKSSLPVDKVYSLLALSTDGRNGTVPVDYNAPVAEIYTKLTRVLIGSRKDLRILSAVQHQHSSHDLPSWVPDWSQDWLTGPILYEPSDRDDRKVHPSSLADRLEDLKFMGSTLAPSIHSPKRPFAAAGGKPVDMKPSTDPAELRLVGRSFARIREVVAFAELSQIHRRGFPVRGSYPHSDETYLTALARTVTADMSGYVSPAKVDGVQRWEQVVELAKSRAEVHGAWTARILFLADNGYIGLGPSTVRAGDEISILYGGDVPYILRRSGRRHKFLGECYCHGIMSGLASGKEKTYILV